MDTQQEQFNNYRDDEKLRSENVQLRKSLEKEEFLHKTLYKQWNELNDRMLAKEREFKQFKSRNLFYKYAFYLILFSVVPVYYLLTSSTKGNERIVSSSQTVSSPVHTINQTPTKRDTVQLVNVTPEKKETIQHKPSAVNKPVIVKPLTDSVRELIYSEGWDAYYEKSANPYQTSRQKYEVWLEGWTDAMNDEKKMLTRKASDTGENAIKN